MVAGCTWRAIGPPPPTAWRRVTETACGRTREAAWRVCVKRCVEVENHFHMKVTAVPLSSESTQQRKNVHQPWPLAALY